MVQYARSGDHGKATGFDILRGYKLNLQYVKLSLGYSAFGKLRQSQFTNLRASKLRLRGGRANFVRLGWTGQS